MKTHCYCSEAGAAMDASENSSELKEIHVCDVAVMTDYYISSYPSVGRRIVFLAVIQNKERN